MSQPDESMTMNHEPTFRYLYLAAFALFVVATMVLGWQDVRVYQLLVIAIGYTGTLVAIGWALRNAPWSRGAFIASVALVAAYLLSWTVEISVRYSLDETPGLLRTVAAQFQIWEGILGQRFTRAQYFTGFMEAYWLVGKYPNFCV